MSVIVYKTNTKGKDLPFTRVFTSLCQILTKIERKKEKLHTTCSHPSVLLGNICKLSPFAFNLWISCSFSTNWDAEADKTVVHKDLFWRVVAVLH